jgi:YgiT-type zinc finger domain-containing protein
MKCVTCQGTDIREAIVDEEIRHGNNVIFVPVHVLKCSQCGERYYDLKTTRFLERVRQEVRTKGVVDLEEIGKVLRYKEVVEAA